MHPHVSVEIQKRHYIDITLFDLVGYFMVYMITNLRRPPTGLRICSLLVEAETRIGGEGRQPPTEEANHLHGNTQIPTICDTHFL
jgi:hypothetical protein